ncbi:DegT/DnrJ/EryC1/StrS family aminotransferase [Actinopolymorpha sp. B17G11]|uniref:DegT/DnrJ/EryC1/StrS family aminotransferase n=1 Tax=unclassified Actinopolymorpha TaxID=2627063 RepID=UPI0032D9855A
MSSPVLTRTTPVRTRPWPTWPPPPGEGERKGLERALDEGIWAGVDGPLKREFERRWADATASRHGLGVSNGTVSLEIALRALGVGSGDEVIVPPYTFVATATAVLGVNALPVFADLDPETYNLDPAAVEAAVTDHTRAVIAVHLGGHPVDLDALTALCDRHGLALIEDAAHAHGAQWNDRPVGAFGAFGSWSFQASKNLTCGEGGALTSNHDDLAEQAWELHNCGRRRTGAWYAHHRVGGNHRLTEWQAAILLAGLDRLPDQIARREECAAVLDQELAKVPGLRPLGRDRRASVHAHHLYLFRYDAAEFGGLSRDDFVAALVHHGIPASSGYPLPLYQQELFTEATFDRAATGWDAARASTRYADVRLPVCERACAETVWLPQNLLLAPVGEMADVLEAVRLVRRGATG